jgi:hypothetical protein
MNTQATVVKMLDDMAVDIKGMPATEAVKIVSLYRDSFAFLMRDYAPGAERSNIVVPMGSELLAGVDLFMAARQAEAEAERRMPGFKPFAVPA